MQPTSTNSSVALLDIRSLAFRNAAMLGLGKDGFF